jgi:hypothetical protein
VDGVLRNLKQASLRPWHWCCSANVKMVAAESVPMWSQSLSSQMSFSLSRLSACSLEIISQIS